MNRADDSPLVTIVIPTRDRQDRVIKCLDSLKRQSYVNFEVVIVNDGSSDDTKQMLGNYLEQSLPFHLRVIHHAVPRGANPSRNAAIAQATGSWIAFLDDDCWADPLWLQKLVEPLGGKQIAAVAGHVENVATGNIWERFFIGQQRVSSRMFQGTLVANRIVAANMLVKKDMLIDALDEDRATVATDVTTSARGDEEGLRLKILRDGRLIAHAPDAVCLHDHPYSFGSFCRQAFKSGQSTARLALKYRLAPRWELLALLAAIVFIPMSLCRIEALAISAVSFCLFLAAVLYNESALKMKTLHETLGTLPALFVYYCLRAFGYLIEWLVHFPTLFAGKLATPISTTEQRKLNR